MNILSRRIAPLALGATLLGLGLWLQPWRLDPDIDRGRQVAEGPSMIIQSGRISPEFVVVDLGSCVTIANSDDVTRTLTLQDIPISIPAGSTGRACPATHGVHRLRSDAGAFTGGFLIADPER